MGLFVTCAKRPEGGLTYIYCLRLKCGCGTERENRASALSDGATSERTSDFEISGYKAQSQGTKPRHNGHTKPAPVGAEWHDIL